MGERLPEWNCKSCHKRNGTYGILNRKPKPTAQCKNIHCKKTFSKSGEQRDPPEFWTINKHVESAPSQAPVSSFTTALRPNTIQNGTAAPHHTAAPYRSSTVPTKVTKLKTHNQTETTGYQDYYTRPFSEQQVQDGWVGWYNKYAKEGGTSENKHGHRQAQNRNGNNGNA
jgi:hypothetical protein